MPPVAPLRSYVDHAQDLASRLRMDRSARAKGAVVVEGPSDQAVLARAFSLDPRALFPVCGRVNVLRIAEIMLTEPLDGVVCVADHDFDSAARDWSEAWFLVFYDDADLEAMLVNTRVLERFLDEWASDEKLSALGGVDELRGRIYAAATPIGVLRAANAREGWGLIFDQVDLTKVVNKHDLSIDLPKLLGRLRSSASLPEELSLADEVGAEAPVCPVTGRILVCGHDALTVVGIALRHLVGSLNQHQTADRFAERVLRGMVGPGDLDDTPFAARFGAALAVAARARS